MTEVQTVLATMERQSRRLTSKFAKMTSDFKQLHLSTRREQVSHCCPGTSRKRSLIPIWSVSSLRRDVLCWLILSTGTSAADQLARLNTAIVALQNVNGGPGSGVGCPIVSTTWTELRTQLASEA